MGTPTNDETCYELSSIQVLTTLGQSRNACDALSRAIGADQSESAIQMLQSGALTGELGLDIHIFFEDEIVEASKTVWEGVTFDPDDEDNPDTNYPVRIQEYEGVFYVWALEFDDVGYFLSLEDAKSEVFGNWEFVKSV